ncbi:hypothetical protein EVAR_35832_1 [Eumeta japonica]|uniref:Uncharacterized protein n=1 Tax=Eumeta variegata TaxID=151549 RepID=A0A4C1WZS4_EUMVA|nr:hypothetical protein EVAR_35832_1 [Eumeta japonica]
MPLGGFVEANGITLAANFFLSILPIPIIRFTSTQPGLQESLFGYVSLRAPEKKAGAEVTNRGLDIAVEVRCESTAPPTERVAPSPARRATTRLWSVLQACAALYPKALHSRQTLSAPRSNDSMSERALRSTLKPLLESISAPGSESITKTKS